MLCLQFNIKEDIILTDTRTGEHVATIKPYIKKTPQKKGGLRRLAFDTPRWIEVERKKNEV